jgi:hypothetical protein
MSFMDHYLLYFRQQLFTHLLSALVPFLPLFTESSCGDLLLASPTISGALIAPHLLCCVLVFSSLFIQFFILFCFVCRVGSQPAQGAMLVHPKSAWGNTT